MLIQVVQTRRLYDVFWFQSDLNETDDVANDGYGNGSGNEYYDGPFKSDEKVLEFE